MSGRPHLEVAAARAPAATAAEKSCCLKMGKAKLKKKSSILAQQNHPGELMQYVSALLLLEQCASFPRFETEGRVLTSLLTCLYARWRLVGLHARILESRNIKPSRNRAKRWPNKRQHAPLDLSRIQGVPFTCHICAVGITWYPQPTRSSLGASWRILGPGPHGPTKVLKPLPG